jgi:glyoxylase-like metal-dependent hydrolase (beta-lactamase superfamily II)
MEINKIKIDVIETGLFGLDGGAMFGVIPKPLWAKSYDAGDANNRIPLQARIVLLQMNDKKILIDTGNGLNWDEKKIEMYGFDLYSSNFDNTLKKFGLTRNEITDVILTHLHFDHTGGSTFRDGDNFVPTFPNAQYYVQKEHFNYAINSSEKDTGSFIKHNFLPLYERGILKLIEGEGELFPGVSFLLSFGHTTALQMVKLVLGNNTFLYTSDFMPTAAHLPFPYIMAYDNNPLITLDEKKKFLPIIAENEWIMIFEHDKNKQAAKITLDDKGKNYKIKEIITITE